jgi:hypothetical protein
MGTEAILAEETILVEKWNTYKKNEKTGKKVEIEEDGMGAGAVGGAPTNSTAGVAGTSLQTGGPVVKKKDIDKYKKGAKNSAATGPIAGIARRMTPMQ